MKISVGRSYIAVSTEPDREAIYWVIQIVSEVQHADGRYFIGLKKVPGNLSAILFNERGETPDTEPYAMGLRIVDTSKARPKWTVVNSG